MSEKPRAAEVIAFRAKRRPLPIPASATRVIGSLGIDTPATRFGVTFSLRRCREGVDIWLHTATPGDNRFGWNLSALLDRWPKTFAEARKAVATYAAQHGQEIAEAAPRRPRPPRGNREDYALLRAGGCREAWLQSDVPTLWGEAVSRCKSPAAECGQLGFCEYGTCDMQIEPRPVEEAEEEDE